MIFVEFRRHQMPETTDRRTRRSNDPIIALHYQLSSVRAEATLEAVVLVDDAGCLVAGAGAWPVCEELAAYVPFMTAQPAPATLEVADQAAELSRNTHMRSMSVDGAPIFLCAKGVGNENTTAAIVRAAAGCRRILGGEV
jgi:hypothetical protein